MPVAVVRIRALPHYRRDAFDRGLRRAGYEVRDSGSPKSPEDLLLIWNRYGPYEHEADKWEAHGGTVLVCENGYLGKDDLGRQLYAISVHGHNGSGSFPVGSEDRFSSLGVELQPWRTSGEFVLVRSQRGIGTRLMASPANWHGHVTVRLGRASDRPVRVILHPGRHELPRPIEQEFVGAWVCVIWASSVGVKALVNGIPVIAEAPHWICESAVSRSLDCLESPLADDGLRLQAMQRMAHGQWRVAEIEAGEPFMRIREFASLKVAA